MMEKGIMKMAMNMENAVDDEMHKYNNMVGRGERIACTPCSNRMDDVSGHRRWQWQLRRGYSINKLDDPWPEWQWRCVSVCVYS
jgi:hypothetical protein